MINVIAGKYRSRVLLTPEEGTLPTKNIVRKAIFSALGGRVEDAVALDLFAGSGALGIEALSLGAKKCYFVDASEKAISIVKRNLATLKEDHGEVLCSTHARALSLWKEKGIVFDLVFLDPPYAKKEYYDESISFLLENHLLSQEAAIVIEYEGELSFSSERFKEVRYYKYGKTQVAIARSPL